VLSKPLLLLLIVVCIENDHHGCSDGMAKWVENWVVVGFTWIWVLFVVGVCCTLFGIWYTSKKYQTQNILVLCQNQTGVWFWFWFLVHTHRAGLKVAVFSSVGNFSTVPRISQIPWNSSTCISFKASIYGCLTTSLLHCGTLRAFFGSGESGWA
jgi:hypothetical protein